MAIKINKSINEKIIHDDDSILTPLYGKIKVVNTIDYDKYSYFDTVDNYDLFISETADDTLAIKAESDEITNTDKITNDVEKIKNNYNVDIVKYDEVMSTIIVKVLENKTDVLINIENDFKEDKFYNIKKVTPQVLFLEITNIDIQLEDDDLLGKLDDNSIKELAKKTGASLSGSESKDELKGIIKGALSSNK